MKPPAITLASSPTGLSRSPRGTVSLGLEVASLSATAQHGDESRYEADDRLTMSTVNPVRLTLGWTNPRGRSPKLSAMR